MVLIAECKLDLNKVSSCGQLKMHRVAAACICFFQLAAGFRGVARGGGGYICPRAPNYRGAKIRLSKF